MMQGKEARFGVLWPVETLSARVLRRGATLVATMVVAATGALGAAAAASAQERGFEMLSPPDKNGGQAFFGIAPDGGDGEFVLGTNAATDAARGNQLISYVLAKRGASAWGRTPLDPISYWPSQGGQSPTRTYMVGRSADGSKWVAKSDMPLVEEDVDGRGDDLYLIDSATGEATWVSRSTDPAWAGGTMSLAGMSRDARHIFFTTNTEVLTPDSPPSPSRIVYEWTDGTVRVASRLRNESAALSSNTQPAAMAWQHSPLQGIARPGAAGPQAPNGGANAVSNDGSRLYFRSDDDNPGGVGIYLREDGARTFGVSESERTATAGTMAPGIFIGANPDGTSAYFISQTLLTNTATAGGGIYRFDRNAPSGSRLTQVAGTTNGAAFPQTQSGPQAVFGLPSDDGLRLYLLAAAPLAAGVTGRTLYLIQPGQPVKVVATGSLALTTRIARVSPDGRYALIQSSSSIGGAQTGGKVALYRYDAVANEMRCVSCRADVPPTADALVTTDVTGYAPGGDSATNPHTLTDDGQVFFSTASALVPEDTDTVIDVYEFDGTQTRLVTPGSGDEDAYVVDNSHDGTDLYIATRSRLRPEDADSSYDVYNARRGEAHPLPEAPPTPCEGDACQGPFQPPVSLLTPGSQVPGTGNAVPPADPPPSDGSKPKPDLALGTISSSAQRSLASGRAASIPVKLAGGGKIQVKLTARLGGKTRTVGSASRTIKQTGAVTANVRVSLSKAARRQLARSKRLRLTIEVRVGGISQPERKTLTLERR